MHIRSQCRLSSLGSAIVSSSLFSVLFFPAFQKCQWLLSMISQCASIISSFLCSLTTRASIISSFCQTKPLCETTTRDGMDTRCLHGACSSTPAKCVGQALVLSHLMLYNLCRDSNTFLERVAIPTVSGYFCSSILRLTRRLQCHSI
jgi:hypothetical protein